MADIGEWIRKLKSPDGAERCRAAEQLAHMEDAAQPAAIELVIAVGDDEESVREWSVAALEGLGAPSPDQLAGLRAALEHTSPDVAYWAATLIGRLQDAGREATAELVRCLESQREISVRERAAWALGKIGDPAALPALESVATQACPPRLGRLVGEAIDEIRRATM